MVSALASRSSGQVWVLAGDIVCCVLELGKTLNVYFSSTSLHPDI